MSWHGRLQGCLTRFAPPLSSVNTTAAGAEDATIDVDDAMSRLFRSRCRKPIDAGQEALDNDVLQNDIDHALLVAFLAMRAEHVHPDEGVDTSSTTLFGDDGRKRRLEQTVEAHTRPRTDKLPYEVRALCFSEWSPTVLIQCRETLYVASRGTNSSKDFWYVDRRCALVSIENHEWLPGPGCVHEGFLKAFDTQVLNVLEQIDHAVNPSTRQRQEVKTVVFCGHSLGGAVAQLLALAYAKQPRVSPRDFPVAKVVSFGCPRIGDVDLGELLEQHVHHRRLFVRQDLVANVPCRQRALLNLFPLSSEYDVHHAVDNWELSMEEPAKSSSPLAPIVTIRDVFHMSNHYLSYYANTLFHHRSAFCTRAEADRRLKLAQAQEHRQGYPDE